jgi:hypothetical protein
MVTGFLTGLSRAPALGAVLPAVLSVLAGFLVVIVSRESVSRVRVTAMVCVISLVVNLLLGTLWGSLSREDPHVLTVNALNEELAREMICNYRLKFELEMSATRKSEKWPETNADLLIPGCSPPFDHAVYAPAKRDGGGAEKKSD